MDLDILKLTKTLDILFVDDEDDAREGMRTIFSRFFNNVDEAKDGIDGLEKFNQRNYDLIITDVTMPKMNGIEMMEKIKEINPNQKVLILSAHQDKEDVLSAINSMADGFLIKPFNLNRFKETITKIGELILIERENEEYKNRLEEMLNIKTIELKNNLLKDSVTNLPNYLKLEEDMKLNNSEQFCLIDIDISNFRKINSIFGIENGNSILEKMAIYLTDIRNEFENIGLYRLKDSSFAYIIRININNKLNISKILKIIENKLCLFYVILNSIEIRFTFKVIAVSSDSQNLIRKHSVISAYLKDKGIKSIYKCFDEEYEEIEKKQLNTLEWANKAMEGVRSSFIEPFFQPIVDNKTQKIIKYEVLARLKQGDKFISPFFFIDPAKSAGILSDITKIIIEKSFKKIANTDKSISINISEVDLDLGYLKWFLTEQLVKNKLDASQITLEVLEGVSSENASENLKQILELKKMGFSIAIDDFGTGYSNFERVYKMSPDFIKIDGAFIKDINSNGNSLKISKAIYNFAKSINAKVIAEFVSKEAVFNLVKKIGIDYSQGYYFAEPTLEIKEEL